MPVPNVSVADLDEESIKTFKELAVKNKRLTSEEVSVDNETLLRNLQLFDGTYENQRRIDEYMFSRTAFRELLYNSLQHKVYSTGNPIQISIYDDKIYIYNSGELPENLKNDLYAKHYSTPYNPKIAQVFFKAGFTESWGRGYTKVQDACKLYECPCPYPGVIAS